MRYFKFPVVLTDQDYEQNKREKGLVEDSSMEYAVGYCEISTDAEVIKLADSWLPTEEAFTQALDGEFTACTVTFDGVGTYEVPMKRIDFKKMYEKFRLKEEEEMASSKPKMEIIHLKDPEDIKNFFKQLNQQNEQDTESKPD